TDIAYLTRYAGDELARIRLPTANEAVRQIRSMGGSWSAAELPHRVSQKFVEAALRRHAEAWPGNRIRYGHTLLGFEAGADGVTARIRAGDEGGPAHTVRARYLVGADGARSLVRRSLGIAWGGETGVQRD